MQLSDLRQLIAGLKAKPSAELDARVHDAIDAAAAQRKQTQPGGFPPYPWNYMMKPSTKK